MVDFAMLTLVLAMSGEQSRGAVRCEVLAREVDGPPFTVLSVRRRGDGVDVELLLGPEAARRLAGELVVRAGEVEQ